LILEKINADNKTSIIPFITCGYPNLEDFIELLIAIENSGASVIEIGIPNSDPLAEGLTIQYSSKIAINNGVNTNKCIEIVKMARLKGLTIPVVLMGYYNNILAYDIKKFCKDSNEAGVNGLIVADLPIYEADTLIKETIVNNISYIPLLSVNSAKPIIEKACEIASGFIYCVSMLGVTGERKITFDRVKTLVNSVKIYTDTPVAVGFGVSNKSDVNNIGKFADAAIVGSALINQLKNNRDGNMIKIAKSFISSLIE
jgi:tryptophan synthase alpha subunit